VRAPGHRWTPCGERLGRSRCGRSPTRYQVDFNGATHPSRKGLAPQKRTPPRARVAPQKQRPPRRRAGSQKRRPPRTRVAPQKQRLPGTRKPAPNRTPRSSMRSDRACRPFPMPCCCARRARMRGRVPCGMPTRSPAPLGDPAASRATTAPQVVLDSSRKAQGFGEV
jgi:hypothetical protein